MFFNYLTVAFRNLSKHKMYSFINIGGLSIGLAACILIFLFVEQESSYDKWMPDSERIYRLESTYYRPGQAPLNMASSPGPMGPVLAEQFSESIETNARLMRRPMWVKIGDQIFEDTVSFVDNQFFDVFDISTVEGDRTLAFRDTASLILSETAAHRYFGEESPIGKTIDLENGEIQATVVAVLRDLPENTHLSLNMVIHLDEKMYASQPHLFTWWLSFNVYSYFKLAERADVAALEQALPSFYDTYALNAPGPGFPEGMVPSELASFELLPISEIHLHSSAANDQIKPTGDINIVYGFSAVATLILLIAVINFTNLTTARSSLRAKEAAIRKVVGASRRQLIIQFLGETALTTSIALLIALVLVEVSLPFFNDVIAKMLDLAPFGDPYVQLGLLAVAAVIGLGAGAHPALTMSSFSPGKVLHTTASTTPGSVKLRSVLTTLQFTISVGLIAATLIIYNQIQFARNSDLGLNTENRLTLYHMSDPNVNGIAGALRQRIEGLPGVRSTAYSGRDVPMRGSWNPIVRVAGQPAVETAQRLEHVTGDYGLLDFLGAKLVAGRLFAPEYRSDLLQQPTGSQTMPTQGGIINETAVAYLGFSSAKEAIGQTVLVTQNDGSFHATQIVGVVEDMRLRSAREAIDPTIFRLNEDPLWQLHVEINPDLATATIAAIEGIWTDMVKTLPIQWQYIDDRFDAFYQADNGRAQVFAYFSVFATFISCLGLYGLASFNSERRAREIGIRKVHGAGVGQLVGMLTLQFSKPVILANILAWPITWYFAHTWLQGFSLRIDLTLMPFASAGIAALLIACATVAGHAFKTAQANPVLALKHE